jgi:hypothetical protein
MHRPGQQRHRRVFERPSTRCGLALVAAPPRGGRASDCAIAVTLEQSIDRQRLAIEGLPSVYAAFYNVLLFKFTMFSEAFAVIFIGVV